MNIQEIRQKYPQYDDMSDEQLASSLHSKFYSDMPIEEFNSKIGLTDAPQVPFFFQENSPSTKAVLPNADTFSLPDLPMDKIKSFGREALPFVAGAAAPPGLGMPAFLATQTEKTPEIVKDIVTNPAVVSTLASVIAPELAIPAAISKIPAVGGLLTTIGQNIPSIFASSAAGGIASGAKEALDNPEATIGSVADKALETGKDYLKGNLLGLTAFHGAKSLFNVGKSALIEDADEIINFAKQNKIPLNPSAVAPSKTAKAVGGVTEAYLPSKFIKRFKEKEIAKVLTTNLDEANSLIAQSSMIDGLNSPGVDKVIPKAREAIKEGIERWMPKMELNYDEFTNSLGGKSTIVPDYPNVKSAMAAALKEVDDVDDPLYKFIQRFAKKTRKYSSEIGTKKFNAEDVAAGDMFGDLTAGQMQKAYVGLGKIKGDDSNLIGSIREAFKKDFEQIASSLGNEDSLALLQKANTEYGAGKGSFFGNELVRKIAKGTIPDERVTVELFRDKNYGVLKQLQSNIPEAEFKNLMRLNLEGMLERTSVPVSAEPMANKIINGAKILKWIDDNPKTFKLLPEETQKSFKNLALYAKLHSKDAIKGSQDLITAMSRSTATTGTAGYLLKRFADLDPTGVGVMLPQAGAVGLSFGLMKPGSVVNRWLTTGIPLGFKTQEALKLGGRELFNASE